MPNPKQINEIQNVQKRIDNRIDKLVQDTFTPEQFDVRFTKNGMFNYGAFVMTNYLYGNNYIMGYASGNTTVSP